MAGVEPVSSKKNFWLFTKSELKGLVVSFWSAFWRSTLLFAVIFGVWLAFRIWTDTPDPGGYPLPDSLPKYFLDGLIIFVISFFYVWPIGVMFGGAAAAWRLFGAWTLLPLFVFPLVLWALFWLAGDFLLRQGLDVVDALRFAYQAHGLPALEGARIAHAGGPAAIILIIFLIPPLLMDSLRLALDPGVLWQLFQFLLSLSLACLGGLLASAVISSIPLLRSFSKRLRSRYETFRISHTANN